MPKTIISDASCFIILQKIGCLDIPFKTYESILTTSIIASEYGLPLPAIGAGRTGSTTAGR